MEREARPTPYLAAAVLAAVGALVNVGLQLTNPVFDAAFTTTADWANEISFILLVSASAAAMWGMIVSEIAPRRGGLTFIVGQAVLLVGLSGGVVLGHAPAWFAAAGVPGNLIALIGLVLVAVFAWRHGTLPRVVAVLLPLSVLLGVGGAEFGGGLVPAIVWSAIAWRFTTSAPRPVAADAVVRPA